MFLNPSLKKKSEKTAPSDDTVSLKDESMYLAQTLAKPLTECLAELVAVGPSDPIEWIAHWLYRYRDSELYFYEKSIYHKNCIAEDRARMERRMGQRACLAKLLEERAALATLVAVGERAKLASQMAKGATPASQKGEGAALAGLGGEGATRASLKGEGATLAGLLGEGTNLASLMGEGTNLASLMGEGTNLASLMGEGTNLASLMGEGTNLASLMGEGTNLASLMGEGTNLASLMGEGTDLASIMGEGTDLASLMGAGTSLANLLGERMQEKLHSGSKAKKSTAAKKSKNSQKQQNEWDKLGSTNIHDQLQQWIDEICDETDNEPDDVSKDDETDWLSPFVAGAAVSKNEFHDPHLTKNQYDHMRKSLLNFDVQLPDTLKKSSFVKDLDKLKTFSKLLNVAGVADWSLDARGYLVCHHKVLGDMRPRPPFVPPETPEWWEQKGYLERTLYDHEIYSTDVQYVTGLENSSLPRFEYSDYAKGFPYYHVQDPKTPSKKTATREILNQRQ